MIFRVTLQSEDFWRITSLDAVAFGLPGVSCDDAEILSSYGQDSSTVLGVGVEMPLLRSF